MDVEIISKTIKIFMEEVMNSTRRIFHSTLLLKTLFIFTVLSLLYSENINAEDNPLRDKLQQLVNKARDIRLVFVDIVSLGQGLPHWDKVSEAVNDAETRFNEVEQRIDSLTSRFDGIELPFPDRITIPSHNVRILGRNVYFRGLNINVPKNNRKFSELGVLFANYLDPAASLMDKIYDKAVELRNLFADAAQSPINENLITVTGDTFPEADYYYTDVQRARWGDPDRSFLASTALIVIYTYCDMLHDALGQDVVVGGGGNVAIAQTIFDAIKGIVAIISLPITDLGNNSTSAEVTASYERLGWVHKQIDTVLVEINNKKDFTLQQKIEENLVINSESQQPLAEYQLPSRLGGQLEKVKEVVNDVIQRMTLAGENTYQASEFYELGNQKYTAGKYKQAYYYYSKAYAEATFVELDY